MNVTEIMEKMQSLNVELWADGKMLRFRAPENALDKETLGLLRRHKKEILGQLSKGGDNAPTSPDTGRSQRKATTLGQEAMYFLHMAAPESPAYNVASSCRIRSPLNVTALKHAFEELVQRHDSLRSTFSLAAGKLSREIWPNPPLDFQELDATSDTDGELSARVAADYQRPFDLTAGPLLRIRVYKHGERDHVMLIALHHIIFDAWSLWLLHDELHHLYAKHDNQTDRNASEKTDEGSDASRLPELSASFDDFVRTQRLLEESEQGEELWKYWRQQLSGDCHSLELPLDSPRPAKPAFRGATHKFQLPGELATQLRALAKSLGVTPFVLMLTIFKTVLHKHTNQSDMVVGTTTSGRSESAYSRLVGFFVNTLPLRSDMSGDPTFADLAQRVKKTVLGALRHQDFPYPLMINRLNARRSVNQVPLCNVMFGLQKPVGFEGAMRLFEEETGHFEMGGLDVYPFDLDQQEGQFDLTLELFETKESFVASLKYDRELFNSTTAEQLANHYLQMAKSVVTSPEARLSQLHVLTEAEQQQLLDLGRGNDPGLPPACTVHQLVEQTAARFPDQLAYKCGKTAFTYQQLNARANQIARELQNQGVKCGDVVAFCQDRGELTPVATLAVWKSGGVYTPIDSSNPMERIEKMVRSSDATFVLGEQRFLAAWQQQQQQQDNQSSPPASCRDSEATCIDFAKLIDQSLLQADNNLNATIPITSPAYVLHTSGSTGEPKGVVVSHRAFCDHIRAIEQEYQLDESDRTLQFSNLTFDTSLEQIMVPWSVGATIIFRGNELWSPERLVQEIENEQLSFVNLPPAYFEQCSKLISQQANSSSSLRLLLIGGDVFPAHTLADWKNRGVRVLNGYGPSETVITATLFDATNGDSTSTNISIGHPRPGTTACVVDEYGQLTPLGTPGELCLGGNILAEGYLNAEELTQRRFVPDPFATEPSARRYRTGDLVRWNRDGQLEFLGRIDRQIKIYGMRVEIGEIESAILNTEQVQQTYVSLDRSSGKSEDLIAWVVPQTTGRLDLDALKTAIRLQLPAHMVPRHLIEVEHLPTNASGKIDAVQLPRPVVEPGVSSGRQFVAAQTECQKQLAEIWAEELNLERVGIKDNFFELGGASLASMRIVSRANDAGLREGNEPLRPELIFEFPTIEDLSNHLASAR